ncbi:MAG: Maf family protein [Bacteroidetes bacterium]|nr:Maf family protein [Bacteroidota bacterium]MDA1334231.1 Maf family protein [Bacteroidota bacterium]
MILLAPLILASASPRRKSLLAAMGFDFTCLPAHLNEDPFPNESPTDMACRLAVEKASTIAKNNETALVLGSDTTVVLDGKMLGKPATEAEAITMLRLLSGRTHEVITSVALVHNASSRCVVEPSSTSVKFDTLDDARIKEYVASGSPMDKAGSYGIQDDQGAFFVREIHGDYYTVVGLPLNLLHRMLTGSFKDLIGK